MRGSRPRVSLPRVIIRLLPVLLLPVLTACQDTQARAQNAELTRRVAALEAQLQGLRAAQARRDPATIPEAQLSAQNCANDLTRALETYRENSIDRRYPAPAQLEVPDTCAAQRINWLSLSARAYTFTISGPQGQPLARQSSGS